MFLAVIDTKTLAIILYSLGAIFQLIASIVALFQTRKLSVFSTGWILLSLGFAIMLTRRVGPLITLLKSQEYSFIDATLTFSVSLLLLIGVLKLRKLFDHMQHQEQKLEQISKFDFLTGALSRYSIIEQGLLEIERSKRLKKPVAIILIDVDKFKNINDKYGHLAGDFVLQQITTICKKILREIDMFARYGGDEFISIFPDSDIQEIKKVANRLQIEISESPFKFQNYELKVSASIGIGSYDPSIDTDLTSLNPKEILEHLIHQADQQMYEIKESNKSGHYSCNFELAIT